MSVETIKAEIAKLDRLQKVDVMHFLIDNVGTEEQSLELTDELKAELDKREAAIKNGTSKLYSWKDIKSTIEQVKSQI